MTKYDDFTIAEWFRNQGAQIGDDCRLQVRSLGAEPYLISIGNHVTLSTDVDIVTHDGAAWLFTSDDPTVQKFGPVIIKDNCFIGAKATIMPGVTIGPNSVVGARSVVTHDVAPNMIVAGCPAKPISDTDTYKKKLYSVWRDQRPDDYLSELPKGKHYSPSIIHEHKLREYGKLKQHLKSYFGIAD